MSGGRFHHRRQHKDSEQRRWKRTGQCQVSHKQGSTTEDNRKIANREDGKETGQGRVSQREGSTSKDNKSIANREDQKQTAQGQLSHRQGSSTGDRNIDIGQSKKWKER